jgi:hypothetical protein
VSGCGRLCCRNQKPGAVWAWSLVSGGSTRRRYEKKEPVWDWQPQVPQCMCRVSCAGGTEIAFLTRSHGSCQTRPLRGLTLVFVDICSHLKMTHNILQRAKGRTNAPQMQRRADGMSRKCPDGQNAHVPRDRPGIPGYGLPRGHGGPVNDAALEPHPHPALLQGQRGCATHPAGLGGRPCRPRPLGLGPGLAVVPCPLPI